MLLLSLLLLELVYAAVGPKRVDSDLTNGAKKGRHSRKTIQQKKGTRASLCAKWFGRYCRSKKRQETHPSFDFVEDRLLFVGPDAATMLGWHKGLEQRVIRKDLLLLHHSHSDFSREFEIHAYLCKKTGCVPKILRIDTSPIDHYAGRAAAKRPHSWNDGIIAYLFYRRQSVFIEYCEGGDLFEAASALATATLPSRNAHIKRWTLEMALALKHVHNAGILHLDFKLENILIGADGRLKLTDFGASQPISPPSKIISKSFSSCYAAPEVLAGMPVGKEADYYSFGAAIFLLYELNGTWDHFSMAVFTEATPLPAKKLIRSLTSTIPEERSKAYNNLLHRAYAA